MDPRPIADQDAASALVELERSVRYCRGMADEIRDSLVQELAAETLRLEVVGLGDAVDAEREVLRARARMVQQCARLLEAVADRLESATGVA